METTEKILDYVKVLEKKRKSFLEKEKQKQETELKKTRLQEERKKPAEKKVAKGAGKKVAKGAGKKKAKRAPKKSILIATKNFVGQFQFSQTSSLTGLQRKMRFRLSSLFSQSFGSSSKLARLKSLSALPNSEGDLTTSVIELQPSSALPGFHSCKKRFSVLLNCFR